MSNQLLLPIVFFVKPIEIIFPSIRMSVCNARGLFKNPLTGIGQEPDFVAENRKDIRNRFRHGKDTVQTAGFLQNILQGAFGQCAMCS